MTTLGQLIFSGILIGSIYALMSVGLTLIFVIVGVIIGQALDLRDNIKKQIK